MPILAWRTAVLWGLEHFGNEERFVRMKVLICTPLRVSFTTDSRLIGRE
jgi:hypothetical protein